MDGIKRKKVVIVTNIPNPYRVPLFNELARQLEELGHELLVVFAAKSYERRMFKIDPSQFEFRHTFLKAKPIKLGDEKYVFRYSGLVGLMRKEKPDHVIVSGFSLATTKLVLLKLFSSFKLSVWSGTIMPFTGKLGAVKMFFRRLLANNIDSFICYGTRAQSYLVDSLGVKQSKTYISYNTVDTEFFEHETNKLRSEMESLQSGVKVLTSISYLTPRKDNATLLKIMKALSEKRSDVKLNLIGDGEERPMLEQMVQDLGLQGNVIFHGFRAKEELPAFMASTDVFLFHTRFDIWGLVLNEAMAAGLACISSVNAGSTFDLIEEGVTGYSADFSNIENVAQKVNLLLNSEQLRNSIGEKARTMIREHINLEKAASGFVNALGL